jgi:hypothetical protein
MRLSDRSVEAPLAPAQRGVTMTTDAGNATLKTASATYAIQEGASSVSFERVDGVGRLEIAMPTLLGSRLPGTGPVALVTADGEDGREAQVVLQWNEAFTSFQATFANDNDFLSLSFFDIKSARTPFVAETMSAKVAGLLDRSADKVHVELPESLARTAQDVLGVLSSFEDLLTQIDLDPTQVIAQQASEQDKKKKKCDKERKGGWLKVIAAVLVAGVGVTTLPLALAIIGAAAVGAGGGYEASQVEDKHKECTEEAEEKPPE